MLPNQNETKHLLLSSYRSLLAQCFLSLLMILALSVAIPLKFNQQKNIDKYVNSGAFFLNLCLCIYAYIQSSKIREYGGKIQMFKDLEKDAFIQENILNNQKYLSDINISNQPLTIDTQFYSDQPPLHHHTTPPPPPQNSTHLDTQTTHAPPHYTTTTLPPLQPNDLILCKNCGSTDIKSNGSSRGVKRFLCNNCNKSFGSDS